jgi:hypothetical protein
MCRLAFLICGYWGCLGTGRGGIRSLVPRAASMEDVSDLMEDLLAELRCSHAYLEFAASGYTGSVGIFASIDPRGFEPFPCGPTAWPAGEDAQEAFVQGFLGCDYHWDTAAGGFVVDTIVKGDPWRSSGGPLGKVSAAAAC